MRYTVDFEFDGHGGPIISMALIAENMEAAEDALYLIERYNSKPGCVDDEWVLENVLPILESCPPAAIYAHLSDFGLIINDWLREDPHPVIIADSPVDIWRFCEVLTTSPDGQWMSNDFQRITFEVHNVDCWPNSLEGAVQHNAYWDARALWEKLRG